MFVEAGVTAGRRTVPFLHAPNNPGGTVLPVEETMAGLIKKSTPDRSKINTREAWEMKYWTKALGVSKQELLRAVDRVGNSASAVRKELGLLGTRHQQG